MNLKRALVISVSLTFILSFKPIKQKVDYVPDGDTAVRIAEAIWLPIYRKGIYEDKPFVARLKSPDVWIVEGTLAKGLLGGVPYIEIQKSDWKILMVTHGK
jgi:NTF2 fold immunity protein